MLSKVKGFIKNFDKTQITTCSYNNSHLTDTSFIQDGYNLYIAGLSNDIHIEQIKFNPNVILKFGNQDSNLVYHGLAEIIKPSEETEKILQKLVKKDKLSPVGIFGIILVKIKPLEVEVAEWDFKHSFEENKPSFIKDFSKSLGRTLKIWIRAVRLPFVSVSILGVIVGAAVAYAENGSMESWVNLLLTVIGIAFFHISVDLFNDFSDHRSGLDEQNKQLTPFSGGSRMIQSKLFSPAKVFTGAVISLLICLGIGLYLNFTVEGNIILYIGLAGAFLGIFYVGAPIKLVYYGLGEIAIFLSFGPAIVFGSYYVQNSYNVLNEQFSWTPIYASILVGLLISLILYINQFPDYEADKEQKKLNWVVILGKKKSRHVYLAFMVLTYVLLGVFVAIGAFPLISLIVLVSLPLPIKAIITVYKQYDNYLAMIPASAMTILTCITFTALLAISLFVAPLF